MTAPKRSKKAKRYLVEISREARELLEREAERIKQETGGKPSGSFLADKIIKERLGPQ